MAQHELLSIVRGTYLLGARIHSAQMQAHPKTKRGLLSTHTGVSPLAPEQVAPTRYTSGKHAAILTSALRRIGDKFAFRMRL